VWHIAGNRHGVPSHLFGADSYRFSTWASVPPSKSSMTM
jgi:hypothetical protein